MVEQTYNVKEKQMMKYFTADATAYDGDKARKWVIDESGQNPTLTGKTGINDVKLQHMIINEQLRENAKIIAQELVDKMGIKKVAFTTSVTIRPETTYYGWVNGQYAKQCAIIAVDEILELLLEHSLDYSVALDYRLYTFVKEELEKL